MNREISLFIRSVIFFITNSKASGVPPIKVEYLAGHSLKGMEQIYTNFRAADCTEILEWQKKDF